MMQMVKVHAVQFECGLCHKKYLNEDKAKECFKIHSEAISALIAGYVPGAKMKARHLANVDSYDEIVTIIKTEGELTELIVLVESEDGSRWWEKIVSYQMGDCIRDSIQNKPTNFCTFHPLVPWSRHPLFEAF